MSRSSTSKDMAFALMFISMLAFTTLYLAHSNLESDLHRKELQKALGVSLQSGVHSVRSGSLAPTKLKIVRTALAPYLNTVPKTNDGRFSPSVVRYMANRYFIHKYGMKITGMEDFRSNTTRVSDSVILQKKLPSYVDGALQSKFEVIGFLEDDVVMLVATLEQLINDDILESIESAYEINKVPTTSTLDRDQMYSILQSYLVEAFLQGNFTNSAVHFRAKQNIDAVFPNWDSMVGVLEDVVDADANEANLASKPSQRGATTTYRFANTVVLAQRAIEEMGPWLDRECQKMKEPLVQMDPQETGRVRLFDFHSYPHELASSFIESKNYLRHLGALDESSASLGPQVIIPNYIQGANNCIVMGKYYSVCCMNECEAMQRQLEEHVGRPSAPVDEIASAVLTLFNMDVNRYVAHELDLSDPRRNMTLLDDLHRVAGIDGGEVHLQGRLFAQWIHFAFPRQCPFPYGSGTVDQRPSDAFGEDAQVSQEELEMSFLKKKKALKQHEGPSGAAGANMWDMHEEDIYQPGPAVEPKITLPGSMNVLLVLTLAVGVGFATQRLLSLGREDKTPEVARGSV